LTNSINGVRRLELHFLRAPSGWVVDLAGLIAPLYGKGLEELKLTLPSLNVAQSASGRSHLGGPRRPPRAPRAAHHGAHPRPAAAVLAEGVRVNATLSELLLTHVEASDETSPHVLREAIAANTLRTELLAGGGFSARSTSVIADGSAVVPSRELRVVAGGRHKLLTAAY